MVKQDAILDRLMKIYREFSRVRRVIPISQMCQFWEDPTVEILVGSDELDALETEFGIEFDDDTAMEMYDMNLEEASKFIMTIIQRQKKEKHDSEDIIDKMPPEKAKRILREIWKESAKGRNHITAAIANIDFKDKMNG
jgi:hypothetical protein